MTFLIFFAACLFTVFTLWLTIAPFLGTERGLRLEHLDEEVREIELLVARRQVLLSSLRELDVDRETEKIAPEDYERFRRRYEAEAVAAMRRLDEIHGGRDWQKRVDEELTERLGHEPQIRGAEPEDEPSEDVEETELTPDHDDGDAGAEDDVEEAAEAVEPDDDDVEQETPAVVDIDQASQLRCVECGVALASDDRFCSKCGTPVAAPQPEEEPVTSEASA